MEHLIQDRRVRARFERPTIGDAEVLLGHLRGDACMFCDRQETPMHTSSTARIQTLANRIQSTVWDRNTTRAIRRRTRPMEAGGEAEDQDDEGADGGAPAEGEYRQRTQSRVLSSTDTRAEGGDSE